MFGYGSVLYMDFFLVLLSYSLGICRVFRGGYISFRLQRFRSRQGPERPMHLHAVEVKDHSAVVFDARYTCSCMPASKATIQGRLLHHCLREM